MQPRLLYLRMVASTLAALAGIPLALAAPVWLGPWRLDAAVPAELVVTRPDLGLPGATLRIEPTGLGLVTTQLQATFDLVDRDFDAAHAEVELATTPTSVHAELWVDGQPWATLTPNLVENVTIPKGRRLTLLVNATQAAASGWHVQLRGLLFEQSGWTLAYSHDVAGLRAQATDLATVVVGADPDWAELAWPVTGTVAATRAVAGDAIQAHVINNLPEQGAAAVLAVDDVPRAVPHTGPLQLDIARANHLTLTVHASAAQPWQRNWQVQLDHVQVGSRAETGCSAGRHPMTPSTTRQLLILLAVPLALLACWRRRPHGGGPL